MMEWRRFEISTVGNGKNRKRGITLEKIKISKKKKIDFLRVTSRVLCPNFKSLAQTMLAGAFGHTHIHSGADKRPLPSNAPLKQAATLKQKRSLQAL